jgi:hypothetical protein
MAASALRRELALDLPVIFVYIGWAKDYDGTEPIIGTHGYLKTHQYRTSEARAFTQDSTGHYRCGVGEGDVLESRAHIVFLARDPHSGARRIVGVYAAATFEPGGSWRTAKTRNAVLIAIDQRMPLRSWPGTHGMRRWALREQSSGPQHVALLRYFNRLRTRILESRLPVQTGFLLNPAEPSATEGQPEKRLIAHRRREGRLRREKIRQSLAANNGRLVCEVPGCGFDFHQRYGELG